MGVILFIISTWIEFCLVAKLDGCMIFLEGKGIVLELPFLLSKVEKSVWSSCSQCI